MLTKPQTEYLLPLAYNAAVRAGAAILDVYTSDHYDIDLKSDMTPITLADRLSHDLIKKHLGTSRIPILSEEGREMLWEERKGWDLFWMVDPLDGTKEFIKGNGEFTVNIALMVDNRPALSVIYVPFLHRIYFCETSSGSFRRIEVAPDREASFSYEEIMGADKQRLPIAECGNTPRRIAVSRSHNTPETYAYIERIKTQYPDTEIIEQGSSYKFCLLAEGTVDYYVRTSSTYEWDTAAGDAILALAGGQTRSLPDRRPLDYNKSTLVNPHFDCRSRWGIPLE